MVPLALNTCLLKLNKFSKFIKPKESLVKKTLFNRLTNDEYTNQIKLRELVYINHNY